nr:retrotransposon-related protein [Tanacetum cinerariifolium]
MLKRFGEAKKDSMPELKNLSMYIAGLPSTIEMNVRMFKPRSLADAFSLSNLQEATLALAKQRYTSIFPIPQSSNSASYANKNVAYPAKPTTTTTLALPGTGGSNQEELIDMDLQMVLDEYKDVFEVITTLPPHRSFDHIIPLKENVRPYRYPSAQKDVIESMIKELLDLRIIRASHIKDKFPIPVIEELIDELQAFENLQQAMVQSPMLALPNFVEEFVIETDAKGFGSEAMLQQQGHPIAFLSKTLAPKHQSLSAYEKKLLAVVLALQKWRGYLLDMHFKIMTDHFSLKYMFDQRITTPFQSKWLPKLLGFDYEIEYKKGKDNIVTDALSRVERQSELFTLLSGGISNELIDSVIASWSNDPVLQKVIQGLQQQPSLNSKYTWQNGQLRRKGKWVVGKDEELRKKIVSHFHELVRNKPDLATYPGLLQPLPIPEKIWLSKQDHFLPLAHPYSDAQTKGLIVASPLKLLQRKMVKQGNRLVVLGLIQWSNRTEDDATWEPLADLIKRLKKQIGSKPTSKTEKIRGKLIGSGRLSKQDHFLPLAHPYSDAQTKGLIVASPLKLLQRKMVKQGNRLVVLGLIQWSNRTEDDATWEPLADLIKRLKKQIGSKPTSKTEKIRGKLIGSGRQGSQVAYLVIYVDDIILTAFSPSLLQQIIDSLHREFDMTDLGALNYFLGISATRHSIGLILSSKKYAIQLLERAHMVHRNPSRTLVDSETKQGLNGVPICHYMHDSREPHFAALKCVLCYVKGTLDFGLHLHASATTSLVVYTDADWAGCPSTDSVVYMSANPVQHQRTKHIEIAIYFVRDMITASHVRVLHVPSRFQYVSIFTKGLPYVLFEDFRSILSVRPPLAPTAKVY